MNTARSRKRLEAIGDEAVKLGATIKPLSSGLLFITELGRASTHWSLFVQASNGRAALNFRSQLRRIGLDIDARLFKP